MKRHSTPAVLTILLTASLAMALTAGCEKTASKTDEAAPTATKVSAEPAAMVVANPETAPAESQDDNAECSGAKKHGEGEDSCGNMGRQAEGEAASGCNQWDDEAEKVIVRDVPDGAIWTTLKVAGMTCGGCERRVIAKVGALDGVYSVEADAELGQVRVAMDKSAPKLATLAAETISALGYRVQ